MGDIEFKRQLAYALTCRQLQKFSKASQLLDELANALIYQSDHTDKSLDDCLFITKSFRKLGRETAAMLAAGVRCDRESHFTINYRQELLELLPDDRVDKKDNSVIVDKIYFLITAIRSNKKLLTALEKNYSQQYVNRIIKEDKTLCFLKAAKLKKFYKLYEKII